MTPLKITTYLAFLFIANCYAITYAEFQLKCVEKKISSNECLQAFEYSENEKANSAYAQKDYATAFPLYLENANKGQITASRQVAFMYRWGLGTVQNIEQAERWYKLTAEKGNKETQFELADFYRYGYLSEPIEKKGRSVPNHQEALKWGLKSANQGNADAQVLVGDIYKEGKGTIKDYKEANKWFTLAARQGHYLGFHALAIALEYGEGVKVDLVKSYMFWNLAEATKPKHVTDSFTSNGRDSLEKKLNIQQLEQAQQMARTCVAKNYKNCV